MRARCPSAVLPVLLACSVTLAGPASDVGDGDARPLDPLARDRGAARATAAATLIPDIAKASAYLDSARGTSDPAAALVYLERLLALDLPDTPSAGKLVTQAYVALADLYREPATARKRAAYLRAALGHATTPAERASLAAQLETLSSGDPELDLAIRGDTKRIPLRHGRDCASAQPLPMLHGPGVIHVESDIVLEPGGDAAWYALEVRPDLPGGGLVLTAATIGASDVRLALHRQCDADVPIAIDDDGGAGLAARLDSGCLAAGTYLLEVATWAGPAGETGTGRSPVDVRIEATRACDAPSADSFEPDGDRAHAARIGRKVPSASPDSVQSGRVHREIHTKSIAPAGDADWVRFQLKHDSLVRVSTACGFPSLLNGFATCENPPGLDSVAQLYYASPTTTHGLCNHSATGVPGQISTRVENACTGDLDCDFDGDGSVWPEDQDDLANPVGGLPACLPWDVFVPSQRPVDPVDNPLAFNDDADAGGGDLGSEFTVCLPRTDRNGASRSVEDDPAQAFEWFVRTGGFAPTGDPADSTLEFDYSIWVQNQEVCRFEREPNDAFPGTGGAAVDVLELGRSIHGIWDFSSTEPRADFDLYRFDVTEPTEILFEIAGFDPRAVDSFLEIWVGPDTEGNFFFTGDENDDVGPLDFRSRLAVALPPACELLDTCRAKPGRPQVETSYFVNVTSAFVTANFPYELRSTVLARGDVDLPVREIGDFGACGSGDEARLSPGETAYAALGATCDFDGFRFALASPAEIAVATSGGGGDTVLQVVDCETGAVLGCDDDGGAGPHSRLVGCVPAGREYCASVRAADGAAAGPYHLTVEARVACEPPAAPSLAGDGAGVCATFATCP